MGLEIEQLRDLAYAIGIVGRVVRHALPLLTLSDHVAEMRRPEKPGLRAQYLDLYAQSAHQ